MDTKDLAEKLKKHISENPKDSDQYHAYEAFWLSGGEGELSGQTESFEVLDGDWIYVLLPDEEGDETVGVLNGEVYTGTIDGMVKEINEAYCLKHDKHICIHCGTFNENTGLPLECEHCERHTTDNESIDDPQSLLEGFTEIEDGDYQMLLLQDERIPTHETKSRCTFLFVRLEYMEDICSDFPSKYHISIITVNPSMAGKKGLKAAADSWGMDEMPSDKVAQCQMLIDYGTYATVWQHSSNSRTECFKAAKDELPKLNMLAGFYIDKSQNAIGSSGWDFMRGDILAGIKKRK